MTDETPMVELDWSNWCPRHLAPLRPNWPAGAGLAMLGMFNAAVSDKRIQAACDGDVKNLANVMRIIRPVCCYLGEGMADRIIAEALAGRVWPEIAK